jgi:Uma2 family endonuclease
MQARYPASMNAPARIDACPQKVRLRVSDFMLLAESGAFADYGKTELIDGEIWVMNAQWSRHARVKSRLLVALSTCLQAIGSDLEALVEVSVRTSDHGMPEPDIVLTTWRGEGPVPVETVALVIEVSDTTLDTDLGRKSDLYAAAGIAEYWVVDLSENRILIHEHPTAHGYEGQLDMLLGEPARAATVAGLEVATRRLLD